MSDLFRPDSEHYYLGWLRRARPELYARLTRVALDVMVHVLEHVDWGSGCLCWASLKHLAREANNDGKGHHVASCRRALALLSDLGIVVEEPGLVRTPKGQLVKGYRVLRPTKRGAQDAHAFSEKAAHPAQKGGASCAKGGRKMRTEHVLPEHEIPDSLSYMTPESGRTSRPPSEISDSSEISDWQAGDVAEWHAAAGRIISGQVFERGDGELAFRAPNFGPTPALRTIAPFLSRPQEARR